MEKIFKTEKELSVYPTLRSSIHHESDIYIVDDETLYKILLYGNRLTRESVVQRLSLYDNPDCVTPTGAIYTPQYEFLGFKMPYLKNCALKWINYIMDNNQFDSSTTESFEIRKNLIETEMNF